MLLIGYNTERFRPRSPVSASGTSLALPGSSQVADQVKPSVQIVGVAGPRQSYFDPFAFKPVTEARFGNSSLNLLRGSGLVNWDFGIFREFAFNEPLKLQFRVEAFNMSTRPTLRIRAGMRRISY